MTETAFHRRGHRAATLEADPESRDGPPPRATPPREARVLHRAGGAIAAWSSFGVCVIGTHDATRAAETWNALVAARHASPDRRRDAELDARSWWSGQRRWAVLGRRGWELVRDRVDDAEPALLLVGVFRD